MKIFNKTLIATSLISLLAPVSAFSEEITETKPVEKEESSNTKDKASLFETIEITAQKRKSSVQSTPISVTAMSGEVLEQMGITNMEDFQFFAPGISITNDSMAIVNIRGIGTTAFGVATDPSSTIYIDGIYQPRPTTGYQDMFDVERVELPRGKSDSKTA